MLQKYREVMSITCKQEDFTGDEIKDLQDLIDKWFDLYVNLLGFEGITNCMPL